MDFVVDDFVISLSLQDKVLPALRQIEKQVEQRLAAFEARIAKMRLNLPSVPSGGTPTTTRPKRKNFDERAYGAANTAQINKMMNAGYASSISAMEAKSKIWAAAGRANLDQSAASFRRTIIDTQNGLRTWNQRQSGFIGSFGRNVNRAGNNVERFGKSASHGHSGLQGLVTGFFALHTAIHLITEAIHEGVQRQRATNAMQFAYSKPGEAARQFEDVKKLSDTYGTNLSEALQQSANLKNLLGHVMNDAELAKYHESLTVEGGVLGNTEEEKNRFTLALEKMAGAKTGGGVQFVQMQKAMSGVMGRMATKFTGGNQTALRELAKSMSGEAFAKMVADFMAEDINSKNASGQTMKQQYAASEQVQLNKVQNDFIDSLVQFNEGAKNGVADFAGSISEFLRENQWVFHSLGSLFGDYLQGLSKVITGISHFFVELDVIRLEFKAWYEGLSPTMKTLVDNFGEVAGDLIGIWASLKVVETIGGVVSALTGLKAAAELAAGVESGKTGLFALVNPVTALIAAILAASWFFTSHTSDDGTFYWDKDDVAKHNKDLAEHVVQPNTNVGDIVGQQLTGGVVGTNKYHPGKSMREIYANAQGQADTLTAPPVLAKQEIDFSAKFQPAEVTVKLDYHDFIAEMKAAMKLEAQDSVSALSFNNTAMDYHPSLPPM